MFVGRTNANVFARPLDAPTGIVQLDVRDTWKKVYLGFKPDVVIVSNVLKGSGYRIHSFYVKDYEDEVKNYYGDGYHSTLQYRWWYEYPSYNYLRIEDDGFSVKITQGWNYTESEENRLYYFASSKNKPELLTLEHNKGRVKSYDEPVRVELGTRPEMLQIVAKNDSSAQLLDIYDAISGFSSDWLYNTYGFRREILDDGGIRYYGTHGGYKQCGYLSVTFEPGTYTMSGGTDQVTAYVNVNGTYYGHHNYPSTFTLTETKVCAVVFETGFSGEIDTVIYPMLNKGDKPLPFEPYTGEEPSSTFRNYIYFNEKYIPGSSFSLPNAMPCNVGTYGEELASRSIKSYPEHDLVEIDDTGFTLKPGLGEYVYYVRPLPGETVM